jgi:hypothetical protein
MKTKLDNHSLCETNGRKHEEENKKEKKCNELNRTKYDTAIKRFYRP